MDLNNDVSKLYAPPLDNTINYKSIDKTLDILHCVHFLDKETTETLINHLSTIEYISDEDSTINMWGANVKIARQHVAYSDKNCRYKFQGSDGWGNRWLDWMEPVRRKVADYLDKQGVYVHDWNDNKPLPNHLVVNFYENGSKYIHFHQDKTKDMLEIGGDDEYIIVSISLGTTRNFRLKRYKDQKDDDLNNFDVPGGVQDGDIIVMRGLTNHCWEHTILKQSANIVPGPRWSLTFRFVRRIDRPSEIAY